MGFNFEENSMSDKYAALRAAAEAVKETAHIARYTKAMVARQDFKEAATFDVILDLLAEREADKARIAELTAERDALREGEMGDAKHSNTRAAADIYFQLVEECEIQPGGSLVEHIDDMRQRIADLNKENKDGKQNG